jgi:drug/metabolite transporter (DMT)-like permease
MSLIYAISVAIFAQTFIYSGLIFMAGKLLPDLLTPIYHLVPGPIYRLLFSSLTVMLIGNCFLQHLYTLQPVLIAGIISTVIGITIVSLGGLLIEQKMPNTLMIIGVIVLFTGALICVYARSRL